MRKTARLIFAVLMLFCTLLQPLSASAAAVDVNRECSLELEYSSEGMGFADLNIQIFRIAQMYTDGYCTLLPPFSSLPVRITGVSSQKEWRDTANTLAGYIAAQQLSPTASAVTDADGKVRFSGLQTGIYLVTAVNATSGKETYYFENFCVFLPRPMEDNSLMYDISAKPKFTKDVGIDEIVTYQVTKLWKDSGNGRPDAVSVEIYKDGQLAETVVLNNDNMWTHTWTAPDRSNIWTVVEKDVPAGYTVVVTSSGDCFTVTNSVIHIPPQENPKMGDSFPLNTWIAVMAISGMLLILLGILAKRKGK